MTTLVVVVGIVALGIAMLTDGWADTQRIRDAQYQRAWLTQYARSLNRSPLVEPSKAPNPSSEKPSTPFQATS